MRFRNKPRKLHAISTPFAMAIGKGQGGNRQKATRSTVSPNAMTAKSTVRAAFSRHCKNASTIQTASAAPAGRAQQRAAFERQRPRRKVQRPSVGHAARRSDARAVGHGLEVRRRLGDADLR